MLENYKVVRLSSNNWGHCHLEQLTDNTVNTKY